LGFGEGVTKWRRGNGPSPGRTHTRHDILLKKLAAVIGGLLLVVLTFAEITAMFGNIPTTEIVNSSFLLILGYFFGQTINKTSSKVE